MKIETHSRSRVRQCAIQNLAEAFALLLNLGRSRKTLSIYTVPRLRRDTGDMGRTVKPDDDNIAILLDSRLSDERMLVTLAHEMVHVRQLARGQLKPGAYGRRAGYWIWQGRRVDDGDRLPPWEQEAYKMEGLLVAQLNAIISG